MNIKLLKTTDTTCQFDILKIEPGTIKGVNIPCILALPQDLKGESKLTLVFNNENGQTLEASVENIVAQLPDIIEGVQFASPVIIPILPSQQEFNQSLEDYGISLKVGEPKQFARECFSAEIPSEHPFYRLDNQVATLIQSISTSDDIKAKLQSLRTDKDTDFVFSPKSNGFGHSGAGAAMLRFALLHPEMLDTIIIGGNGDIIPTPFGANGAQLEYPFGIKDYNQLLGRNFLEADYKGINFQFYIGEREDTKPVYDTIRDKNYEQGKTGNNFAPEEIAKKYKNLYGTAFFERFKNALRQYEENGCTVGLKIYPNDCHSVIKPEDLHGIISGECYFGSNCSEQLQEMLSGRNKPVVFSEQEIEKETIGTPIAIKDSAQSQIQRDLKDLTIHKENTIATQVLD